MAAADERVFQRKSPEQNFLAAGLPPGFEPDQVICRELTIEADGAFRYKNVDRATPASGPGFQSIEDFVRRIALSGYERNAPDEEEPKYLDIVVGKPSYIVIELSPQLNWHFSSGNPAITLGARDPRLPDPDTLYGRLLYVDDSGEIHDRPRLPCRLAYFAAKPVLGTAEAPYLRSINFNVEVPGGTLIVIDPDIRFPGGSGT
jgi:hypothetical protein